MLKIAGDYIMIITSKTVVHDEGDFSRSKNEEKDYLPGFNSYHCHFLNITSIRDQ